jgi:hypothetical protein
MADVDLYELVEEAHKLGYQSKDQVIVRLWRKVQRDLSYLQYRQGRGRHTSHDDTTAEDMAVLALAIQMLKECQS